jgi:hypothetical protein
LLLTNHHYLSEANRQSRKAFAAVEKQFWKGERISDWFDADKERIKDALWHKSCHPVNMTIKLLPATSEQVKEQLVSAGSGSAAARLPTVEIEAKAGEAYLTLFSVVRPMLEMYVGGVNSEVLQLAVDTLKSYPPRIENPNQPNPKPEAIPPGVVNRRTAVAWVNELVKRNAPIAAQCYDFYVAMAESSTNFGTAGGVDTLRNSYALKKL